MHEYDDPYQFLAVIALCWLLCAVNEEGMGHVTTTLEGAVYPEGSSAPDLVRAGVDGGV